MSNLNQIIFDVIDHTTLGADQNQNGQSFGKNQVLMSFQTQIFLPSNSSESESSGSDDEGSSKKTKKVKKSKRTRKIDEKSRWTHKDQINYWKFYVHYQIKKPYQKISWAMWKKDSIYKEMAKFIGKTSKQCKSKDQNMKSKCFSLLQSQDIVEIALSKLEKLVDQDAQIQNYLNEYYRLANEVSDHMKMLEKRMEIFRFEEYRLNSMFTSLGYDEHEL